MLKVAVEGSGCRLQSLRCCVLRVVVQGSRFGLRLSAVETSKHVSMRFITAPHPPKPHPPKNKKNFHDKMS